MKVTLSVIKADIGGFVGHSESHPEILARAAEHLAKAKKEGLLIDCRVAKCGDDLQLVMTHQRGENDAKIHQFAWDVFVDGTKLAKSLKLHGAGQDLLSDAFSGNVRGMGPGVAEMEFEERSAETVLIFMADKTSAGAWNLPLYKMFADPFNTIGLVIADDDEMGVEGRHFEHFRQRQPHLAGQCRQVGVGDAAMGVLDPMQVLDQQVAPPWCVAQQRAD